jgi:type IV pilus assembly protein PilX
LLLDGDQPAQGYYATWFGDPAAPSTNTDPSTWTAAWDQVTGHLDGSTGNTYKRVVHRLCKTVGDPNGPLQECSSTGTRAPGRGLPPSPFSTVMAPMYRITTQVIGPRNTVSYIQVLAN